MCSLTRNFFVFAGLGLLAATVAHAQQSATQQDKAVGSSINYVFATDLGSGVYDMNGRSLQVYQLTYEKELRETKADQFGVEFELPVTFGFFNFNPQDVLSHGIPTRVDSLSAVPGLALDYLLGQDWHVKPYVRAGFSVASSSVNGYLWGSGVQVEKRGDFHGWDGFTRSELSVAGVDYRSDVPNDRFVRLRQGVDLTRGLGWKLKSREVELGLYNIYDLIVDPPTAPVVEGRKHPIQAEFGFTFATRPRYRLWKFNAPRLGFGYRLAGELSAWRFVIGEPF
ncbi:MAG TPA: hypothetical protein VGQ27_09545 [Steroidobacteraceae bacterium]|nr:hypothetical protein [Steroidobacteraceae bacterium]